MTREQFKLRMKSLKSYRELNPDKGYWDWKIGRFDEGGILLPEVEILGTYPRKQYVYDQANSSQANFIRRAKDVNRSAIPDWKVRNAVATHKLSYAEDGGKYVVYPDVLEINGSLYDFTDPRNGHYDNERYKWTDALDSAINRKDTLVFDRESDARYFTEHYKEYYPISYLNGGVIGRTVTDAYGDQTHYLPIDREGDTVQQGGEVTSYSGPQYHEVLDQMRQTEPATFNQLAENYATWQRPTSEIVNYVDANGNIRRAFNAQGLNPIITPDMLPGIGDAYDVYNLFNAARNQDWLSLGLQTAAVLPFVPGRVNTMVNRNYFAQLMEEMIRRDKKKHDVLDLFYDLRNNTIESLIENEDAFRRAANADRVSGSNYKQYYLDLIRNYNSNPNRGNPRLPQAAFDDRLVEGTAKALVNPKDLSRITLNPRYASIEEVDPVFLLINPGLIRHEMGHIADESAGLNYTNRLSNPDKFVSDDKLKEMFPKSHTKLKKEVLNRGSEIKSYMNEFRDFLMEKHDYPDGNETLNGFKRRLDKYGKEFPTLRKIFDSYKSKKEFIKDYNDVPIVSTEQNSLNDNLV